MQFRFVHGVRRPITPGPVFGHVAERARLVDKKNNTVIWFIARRKHKVENEIGSSGKGGSICLGMTFRHLLAQMFGLC